MMRPHPGRGSDCLRSPYPPVGAAAPADPWRGAKTPCCRQAAGMTRRIVQRPLAEQDIIDQALHIHRDNPAAARRFLAAVDRTLAMLLDLPEIGATRHHERIEGLRMWRVGRFDKHLIFYRPVAEGIEMIRVLHASRDLAAVLHEDSDG